MALGERLWQELLQPDNAWEKRLEEVNQQLLSAYGLPLPSLDIDADLSLDPCAYRFRLAGGPWEQGLLYPGRWFATGDEESVSMLMGEQAQEPVYGLDGRWIPESRADGARQLGCHLLGPEALWVGHLCDRLESRLHLCLEPKWLGQRLHQLGLKSPGSKFAQVLRWLLEERVSIAPMAEIVEAYRCSSGPALHRLRSVRLALNPRLTTPWLNEQNQLVSVALSETTSKKLRQQLAQTGGPDMWYLNLVMSQLQAELQWAQHHFGEAALVVPSHLRRDLFELLPFDVRRTPVLAFDEIPPDLEIVSAAVIGSRLHPLADAWPRLRWEGPAVPQSDPCNIYVN